MSTLEYILFCSCDTINAFKVFEVNGFYVCDHGYIGRSDLSQCLDFTKVAHSHFENSNLMFMSQVE